MVDLDCDGEVDTVSIEWANLDGTFLPRYAITGATIRRNIVTDDEALPYIVAFADLEGDGFRDALVYGESVDGVWVSVLSVTAGSLELATFAPNVSAWERSYTKDLMFWNDACLTNVLPRVEFVGSSVPVISVAVGDLGLRGSCTDPERQRFVLRQGVLYPYEPSSR